MLLARGCRGNANVQALIVSHARGGIGPLQSQWRSTATLAGSKHPTRKRVAAAHAKGKVECKTDVAEKLFATGLTRTNARWKAAADRPRVASNVDRARINLVDERLCDDIFSYYGHTLRDRHHGCDILDLFPGPGVWSRKLNDLLQPRSHILLEPDAKLYQPFLEPLLERPGTKLLARSGIEWEHLGDILSPEILPHQVRQGTSYPPQRNDTLLVTANLSWSPKKRFHDFPSVAVLALYQFMKAIHNANWFQSYGLVRMLVWIPDDEKSSILPRSVQVRRRLAVEAELASEWIVEVAGSESDPPQRFVRDDHIEIESVQRVIERMRDQGIVIPPGRESSLYLANADRKDKVIAGQQPAEFTTPRTRVFDELVQATTADSSKQQRRKLQVRRGYYKRKEVTYEAIHELLKERQALEAAFMAAGDDKEKLAALKEREEQWEEQINRHQLHIRKAWQPTLDNLTAIRQDPSLLMWDRRPVEPLQVKPNEFLPNFPCALIDIQPKAVSRQLWQGGVEREKRAPDIANLLLQHLLCFGTTPVPESLRKIHPGADQDIMPGAPSIRDPALGGSPLSGWGALVGRCLNERQINELMAAWMESPFSPNFQDMVRSTYADDDEAGNAMLGRAQGLRVE
ncbi:hypothetical protein V8F20_003253 [Naviculisporaceae sp. PSN 640]